MKPFVTQEFIVKKIKSYDRSHLLNNLFYTLKQISYLVLYRYLQLDILRIYEV